MRSEGLSIGHLRAITVAFLMVGMAFVSLLSVSENTEAVTPQISTTAYAIPETDGYIRGGGASYPPDTTFTLYDALGGMYVGQYKLAGDYFVYRGFSAFNTSGVPDDATVVSAKVYFRTTTASSIARNFDVQIYSDDFGPTLDLGDFNLTGIGDFQGILLNTASWASSTWFSLNVDPGDIDKAGLTGYVLKSSYDNTSAPTSGEFISFYCDSTYLGSTDYVPRLSLTYAVNGTLVTLELLGGGSLTSAAYPEISDWNTTYDIYRFDIDTVPNTENITIIKGDNWIFQSSLPYCNYSDAIDEVALEDVYDSICYRVWFKAPKASPYVNVHVSLYNAFTGEGFYWEQMKVMISDGLVWDNTTSEWVTRPDFTVTPNQNYTVRVLDFFDNVLVDYPFAANIQDSYLSIAVPYYSWQVFNMNEQPVLMKIYWNNSGSPWEFFVGPQWIIERFLKGGNYTFMVTFYEADGTAGSTVSYQRTVPNTGLNASFIYITGTNLSEIISDIEGVMAVQAIITSLVSPSVVLIYENLPLAPVQIRTLTLQDSVVIDPYEILEATTYQNATGTRYIDTTLVQSHPNVVAATYYVLSDVLSFSGTYATEIYINDSLGANLFHNTVLPATVNLDGQAVTIWADANYSVSRASTFREVTEYTINYYMTQHKWETNMVLNNSHTLDYYTPYWYIAFPENATINLNTVTLYDLDNSVYLSQRTNFDVTAGGVHVTLTQLNASLQRNFRLTFWDGNTSSGIGAPNLIAEAYTQSSLNGISMKYTGVQWTNPYSVEYRGEVYITLNFTYGDCLVRNSIYLIDETSGLEIPQSQYIYTGRTILILTEGVKTVPVGGARNYGLYFTLDTSMAVDDRQDFFFGPIVVSGKQFYIGGVAVSWFVLLIGAMWGVTAWRWWRNKPEAFTMVIFSGSVTVIGFYMSGFM